MDKPVIYVERTCTEVSDDPGSAGQTEDRAESRPLSHYRDHGAYVLLGAPGAGKTEEFKHEAGERGLCDARDFTTYGHERWSDVTPLFIDGLDEMRAGTTDGRTPLDAIRQKLDQLERPRFRLSCREADWFGSADRKRLESVSPDGIVRVLRLDPLTDEDIRTILDADPQVADIGEFVAKARDRGLESLLRNPKSLDMLARAVSAQRDGAWPVTRTETFDLACRALVREHNDEHNLAERDRRDFSGLLNAAGRLCAVQLLTGSAGYHRTGNQPAADYIALHDLPNANTETLRVVLGSKLFRSPADDRVVPVHRHVAEFLAGRYLSNLVGDGLPVQRVLALVTGEDGRTVSALRGLAAWFAAHCKAARQEIVERDPLGAILYGDVRSFSVEEKTFLLTCMEQSAGRDPRVFEAMHDLDSRWEDLATPDMEETFREILTRADGTQGRQTVALAVLQSLQRGAILPGLAPMLLDIVRDNECWSVVREAALEAYARQSRVAATMQRELKALLDDVHDETLSDALGNIAGRLLKVLYPKPLSPMEVVRYLHRPRRTDYLGFYEWFWEHDVAELSTDEQLAGVLDSMICCFHPEGRTREYNWSQYWLRTIPGKLLAAYLTRSPEVDCDRLFSWLDLASKGTDHHSRAKIRTWLNENPAHYKAVVRLAADRYAEPSSLRRTIELRLFDAVPPADFGEWCLTEVLKTRTNTEAASNLFLDCIVTWQDNEDIANKDIEARLARKPSLLATYRELRQRRRQQAADFASASAGRRLERETQARERRREWRELVKANESALRANQAAPELLYRLGSAYVGNFVDVQGDAGRLRLRELLGNERLVDAVVEAFRASTTRADLPSINDVLRLSAEQRHHFLMLPFLLGLQETPCLHVGELPLDEQGVRRALAYLFNTPDSWNQQPRWYRSVLKHRPRLVAEVLVRIVQTGLRRGVDNSLGVYELGHDRDYKLVAGHAVVPLLESFPTRCAVRQLNVLRLLLHAARLHVATDPLQRVIETKLRLQSMDTAQRVYWLTTGLLVAPGSFVERLRQTLTGRSRERRIRRMAEFLFDDSGPTIGTLDVSGLELLIESLGSSYRPYDWPDDDSREQTPTHTTLLAWWIR